MIPENSTDVICFESSDPLIASVTSKGGTISAKSIGSTYVTIYSKETSANNNSDARNVKDKIKDTNRCL